VTGGYVCVPVAVAARLRRVPLAVFLPDVVPGHAVRLVARLAGRVAASTEAALAYLPPGKSVVTGYPVRRAVRQANRPAARVRHGLPADGPVVLVFGGSRGARRLNNAVAEAAPELLARVALVHVSGPLDAEAARQARARLPKPLRARYRLYDFLHDEDMAAALAAADLVVSRAGAAVLGEYPARGLPSVLVPLPIAGGHQAENAAVLAAVGAAVIVQDAALDGKRLVAELEELMGDPRRLEAMGRAARSIDRPAAAGAVWRVVTDLAHRAVQP
jgi:UDP-N-acetylglucosamine--N-acetylmuramyl-(pentapeptide) pyrophosphoryl-undecaprenol N-acetylglucosamine transferase